MSDTSDYTIIYKGKPFCMQDIIIQHPNKELIKKLFEIREKFVEDKNIEAFDSILSSDYLASPFRTEDLENYVCCLQKFLAGKTFDLLSVFEFITRIKEKEIQRQYSQYENSKKKNRKIGMQDKSKKTLLILEKYLLEIDELWKDSKRKEHKGTETKKNAVTKIFYKYKKEIIEKAQNELSKHKDDIKIEWLFTKFQEYLECCKKYYDNRTMGGRILMKYTSHK